MAVKKTRRRPPAIKLLAHAMFTTKSSTVVGSEPVETPMKDNIFPIVGIGASAGGLAAFEVFFSAIPVDVEPDMAFVVVQHLAPEHKSLLAELMRKYTRMPVYEVEDGMRIQRNCVYIIPPNFDMSLTQGTLQLIEYLLPRGQRLPIDFFFRSLAQDQREQAIVIVLSGSGSDGTLGVRAVKAEGGMVMVQSLETCEFDAMPRSVIATGLVDYQLPPEAMPAQLLRYVAMVNRPHTSEVTTDNLNQVALKKIFLMLRTHTGHDFSNYKPNTINRRIERRMAVHQLETIDAYVKYLQHTPAEVNLLFGDLLIGVTHFFRDPEAFLALETQVIPQLFANKTVGSVIRVWSVGCSTGEEAYSIAILLQEYSEKIKQSYALQVFATDIDGRAIAAARAGIYSATIALDVTPERLARFFSVEDDGRQYRIKKVIRDMLVFSEQDVIKDPPFSKLDLISCRNLLIYLNAGLQKKLMPLFHYALNPQGLLFLGASEGTGEFSDLFAVLDRKAKLYQRKTATYGMQRLFLHQGSPMTGRLNIPQPLERPTTLAALPHKKNVKASLRELVEQALLQQLAPVAVLVNAAGDVVYVHGRSGLFLEPMMGESAINNILKMAREGLRPGLYTALQRAVSTQLTQYSRGLNVKTNGHFTRVNVGVHPMCADLPSPQVSLYLVMLEQDGALQAATAEATEIELITDDHFTKNDLTEKNPTEGNPAEVNPTENALVETSLDKLPAKPLAEGAGAAVNRSPGELALQTQILALKQEMRAKDEYLQSAQEELESSNEELKSANEEMQSVNEELQSTNEELETSKEELQSVNEELATVNVELQTKLADITRANNDMNNLLAGTGIATVFIDLQLRILRFTPSAVHIVNLIATDIGRPLSHLVSNLSGCDSLMSDVQVVLQNLIPLEREVKTYEGKWYAMRVQPYRTLENVIEGAVLTFADITESIRTREALHLAHQELRLAVVVRDAFDAITVQDLDGRILAWNPAAVRLYGWSEAEALLLNAQARIPAALCKDDLAKLHQLSRQQVLQPYCTQRLTKDGVAVKVWMIATALLNEAGQIYAIATTERALD